jgi:hypothetical protein
VEAKVTEYFKETVAHCDKCFSERTEKWHRPTYWIWQLGSWWWTVRSSSSGLEVGGVPVGSRIGMDWRANGKWGYRQCVYT